MDMTRDREAIIDAGPWKRNLIVCVFGSFTTILAMTLLLPFLPIYVEQLGATDHAAIVQWSGIAYGATFFSAALTAPLWGRLADRYGRKLMLIRASLGMAVAMSLIGMAHSVWQLVALRLLAGLLGGYASGSMVLVAAQTPKARSGWALGVLSAGIMAGNLVGPLIGGVLPPLIGIRSTFFLAGAVIFVTFLGTTFFIREEARPAQARARKPGGGWSLITDKLPIVAMLVTGLLLMVAQMSIEPIITVYVAQLVEPPRVTFVAGVVMSAAALGSILSSSRLGRLADRIGHWTVITASLAVSALLADPASFRRRWVATDPAALPDGPRARRTAAMHRRRHQAQRARNHRRRHPGLLGVGAICRPGDRAACRRFCWRTHRHARCIPRHQRTDGRGSHRQFHGGEAALDLSVFERSGYRFA